MKWQIDEDCHFFYASSVMGHQFSSFVSAVYLLYAEENDSHGYIKRDDRTYPKDDASLQDGEMNVKTSVEWDGEGPYYWIIFQRKCSLDRYPVLDGEDTIEVHISSTRDKSYAYLIDGRDLCYAVAKACTEAIRKYGFY
ncbi:MAG: hypothetical protein J6X34_02050, partial [Clostridia bacterium]|nr:hypothetical protein [Clostridia bacterium]